MARVTQEEMDRRIAAAGGSGLTHSPQVSKQKVRNPAYGIGEGQDPSVDKEIEVPVQRWKSADGAEIQAYQLPDGSWEVTLEQPAPPKPAAATSPASPSAGATTSIEGTPDPSKPGGFDNERPVKVTRDAKGNQVGLAVPLVGKELQDWYDDRERSRNPGRKTDAQIKEEKDRDAARPGTKIGSKTEIRNGKRVTVETWRLPDGTTEERTGEEPEPVKPGTVIKGGGPNGEDVQAVTDPKTGLVSYQPISGASNSSGFIAGAPKFSPDYEQDDLGLTAYNDALIEWVRAGGTNATKENARKLLEQAGALAQQTASHGTTRRNQAQATRGQNISQRGQDISEVSSRRASANGMFQDVNNTLAPYASKIIPGAGSGQTVVDGYRAMLNMGKQNAEDWGGMKDIPQVPESTLPGGTRMAPGGAVVPAGPPPPSRETVDATNAAVVPQTSANLGRLSQPPANTNPPSGDAQVGNPPAAAPAAVSPGLERPDDLLDFVADSASPAETMTRAAFDAMTPSQQAYYRSRLINARSGSSGPAPANMPSGSDLAPGVPSPMDPDGRPTVFEPVPPVFTPRTMQPAAPAPLPPNELTLMPGGSFQPQPVAAASGGSRSPGLFNPDDYSGHLAEIGLSPEEAQNVLELYRRGVRAEHL